MADSRSALSMRSGRLGWLNWTAERLTATTSGSMPRSIHWRNWASAVRSTHSPIGAIRPVVSAIGMNSAGETAPHWALSQRSSTSAPTIWPLASSICGW